MRASASMPRHLQFLFSVSCRLVSLLVFPPVVRSQDSRLPPLLSPPSRGRDPVSGPSRLVVCDVRLVPGVSPSPSGTGSRAAQLCPWRGSTSARFLLESASSRRLCSRLSSLLLCPGEVPLSASPSSVLLRCLPAPAPSDHLRQFNAGGSPASCSERCSPPASISCATCRHPSAEPPVGLSGTCPPASHLLRYLSSPAR